MNNNCKHFNIIENCQSCQEIQDQWYEKLEKKGFKDIEERKIGLLKKWTGVSDLFDIAVFQDPYVQIQSSWPEPNFKKEEELLNHKDFESICQSIFKHKNNAITYKMMILIWQDHCNGLSLREIETRHSVHNVTVFRAIRRLKEMVRVMDLEETAEKVVIRKYDPQIDPAFIFSTWRRSEWFEKNPGREKEPIDPIFYRLKTKQIKLLLNDTSSNVRIACLNTNPDQIIGYALLRSEIIEFVYVKLDYRKQGIATLLTKGFEMVTRPITKIGASIVKRRELKIYSGEQNGKEESINFRRTKMDIEKSP